MFHFSYSWFGGQLLYLIHVNRNTFIYDKSHYRYMYYLMSIKVFTGIRMMTEIDHRKISINVSENSDAIRQSMHIMKLNLIPITNLRQKKPRWHTIYPIRVQQNKANENKPHSHLSLGCPYHPARLLKNHYQNTVSNKRKPPCIGGMELVSLSWNHVFISAQSVGRGWS